MYVCKAYSICFGYALIDIVVTACAACTGRTSRELLVVSHKYTTFATSTRHLQQVHDICNKYTTLATTTKMQSVKQFYVCGCFFTHNIFLKRYKQHVTYFDDDNLFTTTWKEELSKKGCKTDAEFNVVLQQVKAEVERRRNLGQQSLERREQISSGYKPLHAKVYKLQESFFAPDFLQIVEYCRTTDATAEGLLTKLIKEEASRVFSFPVFTREFCDAFIEEIAHFEASSLPKERPNTMNNYGVLLLEIGFDENFLNPLRINYLTPLAALLFPDTGGASLDSHRAFVVKYKLGEDVDLNYHYDNAEVTLNVSLGKEFTDGDLYFGDMRQLPREETRFTGYLHKSTFGLLHRGQHMHGATAISDGERYNLIIWMRSSRLRNKMCPMCDQAPHLVESIGYGDGFTRDGEVEGEQRTVNVCVAL